MSFVTNALGDVRYIVNTSGAIVVTYAYDTWGKVISTSGSLASTVGANNPIRYRGYYYDTETSLYYLQSRYYDPNTGRFISPDQIIDLGNLYAYCGNDPINYVDHSGYYRIIGPSASVTSQSYVLNNSTNSTSSTIKTYGGAFHEKNIGPNDSVDVGFFYYDYALIEGNKLIGGTIGLVYFEHNPMFVNNFGVYWGIAVLTADAFITYAGFELRANIWSISGGLDIYDVKVGLTGYIGVGVTVDFSNGIKVGAAWGVGGEVDIRFSWLDLWKKIKGDR